jgi:hypothetical protein
VLDDGMSKSFFLMLMKRPIGSGQKAKAIVQKTSGLLEQLRD